jgi:leader peptidase (prepilin peptidase) / N-methyltransferase
MPAVIVAAGLLGSVVGSFLNVLIYRIPRKLSVVSPPSACPHCGAQIRAYDNIPVLSWLVLRAKCRACGAPISARYPAVELGTALLFASVAWLFTSPPTVFGMPAILVIEIIAFLYLAAVSITLALIDVDTHTLPSAIIHPSYVVVGVLLAAASLLHGDVDSLVRALIGAVILGAVYFALAFAHPGGMGLGDVRLAVLLGFGLAWLGWDTFIVGSIAAFVLGGLFGVALMLLRRAGRKTAIAFGPWMLIGAWIGILGGERLASSYLAFYGI